MIDMTATATGPGTTLAPVAGKYGSLFEDPELKAITETLKEIDDPLTKGILISTYISDRNAAKVPGQLRDIRQGQFEDYMRFRPYAFGDLVARNFVEGITKIPGQIAQARQMYGPEAATAFGKQVQGLNAPTVPRYF